MFGSRWDSFLTWLLPELTLIIPLPRLHMFSEHWWSDPLLWYTMNETPRLLFIYLHTLRSFSMFVCYSFFSKPFCPVNYCLRKYCVFDLFIGVICICTAVVKSTCSAIMILNFLQETATVLVSHDKPWQSLQDTFCKFKNSSIDKWIASVLNKMSNTKYVQKVKTRYGESIVISYQR